MKLAAIRMGGLPCRARWLLMPVVIALSACLAEGPDKPDLHQRTEPTSGGLRLPDGESWTVERFNQPEGEFKACALGAQFEDGTIFILSLADNRPHIISITDPGWEHKGYPERIFISIGDGYSWSVPKSDYRAKNGSIIFPIEKTYVPALLALSSSDDLTLRGSGAVKRLDISAARDHLGELVTCTFWEADYVPGAGPGGIQGLEKVRKVPEALQPDQWVSRLLEAAGVPRPKVDDWGAVEVPPHGQLTNMFQWKSTTRPWITGLGWYSGDGHPLEPEDLANLSSAQCAHGRKSNIDLDSTIDGVRIRTQTSHCQSPTVENLRWHFAAEFGTRSHSLAIHFGADSDSIDVVRHIYGELGRIGPDYIPR